jgi:hypothetical protein
VNMEEIAFILPLRETTSPANVGSFRLTTHIQGYNFSLSKLQPRTLHRIARSSQPMQDRSEILE